jgi:riboflavin synthase
MFTGIIESTGAILQKSDTQLTVERPASFDDLKLGASIAISGVCLTVVEMSETQMTFDVVAETWSKTKLGDLQVGDLVNLERALRADGRLDGHIVQGHVEEVGIVTNGKRQTTNDKLHLQLPKELLPFVVQKGSITLDGVALTVTQIEGDTISVALIPETLERTTLGRLQNGDRVNVETDILGRYIHAMLARSR